MPVSVHSTPQRILDVAERLIQERGYNAFSYAHIAAELGITTASVHYHYSGKAELGEAVVRRYTEDFTQAMTDIGATGRDAPAQLAAYADLYAETLRGQRMCLCGMFAAERDTLPQPISDAVVTFFDANEAWLERVLEQGCADRTLRFAGAGPRTRSGDRQRPRGGDAARPRVRRGRALSGGGGATARQRLGGDDGRLCCGARRLSHRRRLSS